MILEKVKNNNTLVFVGSGIKFMSHLTYEAKNCIEKADKVLYLVNEPAMQQWIQSANVNAESLDGLYVKNDLRNENYLVIADYIVKNLSANSLLCVVMYGHPTVLVQPTLYAVKKAIQENYNVVIMPGISAEACLIADLMIDPSSSGCASFEATDFLLYQRSYDSSSHLILWQPFVIGVKKRPNQHNPKQGLLLLVEYLSEKYSADHKIFLYEAAQYPSFKPLITSVALSDLPESNVTRLTTLYIPPAYQKTANSEVVLRLNQI